MKEKQWAYDCSHSFTFDATEEMCDIFHLPVARTFLFEISKNGDFHLCDYTTSHGGITFSLPNFKFCPICGFPYPKKKEAKI